MAPRPSGTIDDITQRLLLWVRRRVSGLAKVEYSSEFARQKVLARLWPTLQELGIPFYPVVLPAYQAPGIITEFLNRTLDKYDQGLVSITGFTTAFYPTVPLAEALSQLNMHREVLAHRPFQQIWWMLPIFSQHSLLGMPDLTSWFAPQLRLTEIILPKMPKVASLRSTNTVPIPDSHQDVPENWALTQGNLGAALLEQFQLTREAEALDKAVVALEAAGTVASVGTDNYVWIHRTLGVALNKRYSLVQDPGDLVRAAAAYGQAAAMTPSANQKLTYLEKAGNSLCTLGVALDYRYSLRQDPDDLAQAAAAYRQAAAMTPSANQKLIHLEKAGDSLYQLGVALTQTGQWYESLARLEDSLETYRQAEKRLGRANALQQIARTHYLMGNFDKARMYFRDALRLYQAEENQPGEAACRAGLGRLLLRLNFVDDAIAELNQACDQYRALGDDTRLANVQDTYELAQKVKERQPL